MAVFQMRQRRPIKRDALGRRSGRVKPREDAELRRLNLEGLTGPEIAHRLGRDPRTVRRHLKLAEQAKEDAAKTVVLDTAQARELIRNWRTELRGYTPVQFALRWLEETSAKAGRDFLRNRAWRAFYHKAKGRHFRDRETRRLALEVESDPRLRLLRERFPTSAAWAHLEAWAEQAIPYISIYWDLLDKLKTTVEGLHARESIGCSDTAVFLGMQRVECLYALTMACGLLAKGLAELPGNMRYGVLIADLEKLQDRVELEVFLLTNRALKYDGASDVDRIWSDSQDIGGLIQRTRDFLAELVRLQSTQDSLLMAMQEMELSM